MVVAEAAMHGRPVVGSDDPAIAASVHRLGNGRVVPAGSADALAEGLRAVLGDDAYARQLGDRGATAVRELHGVPAVTAQHQRIYRALQAAGA